MKTKTTTEDVADYIEFCINRETAKIKTKRGLSNKFELKMGRKTFEVEITLKSKVKQKAKRFEHGETPQIKSQAQEFDELFGIKEGEIILPMFIPNYEI